MPSSPPDPALLLQALLAANDAEHQELCRKLAALPSAQLAAALLAFLEQDPRGCRLAAIEALSACADDSGALYDVWKRLVPQGDRNARAETLQAVSRLERARAAQLLPLFAADEDPLLRRRALNALQGLGGAACLETALRLADDNHAAVRLQAARALARFAAAPAIPALMRLAQDVTHTCRTEALKGLLEHNPFAALLAAAALQRGGSPEAKLDALIVFSQYTPEQLGIEVQRSVATPGANTVLQPEDLAVLLERAGAETIEALDAQAQQTGTEAGPTAPDWLRLAIVFADTQATGGDPRAVQRLYRACADELPAVRAAAVQGLARHDEATPADVLGPLLQHEFADVRRLAAELLERAGTPAVRWLYEALADEDPLVRRAGFIALARVLSEEEVGLWRKALDDDDAQVREEALKRLLALPKTALTRAVLAQAARNSDRRVRDQALGALLERDVIAGELGPVCRDALKEALADAEKSAFSLDQLQALVKIVGKLYPSGSLAVLVAAAHSKSAALRRAAVDVILEKPRRISLSMLADLADTDDPDILKRVAVALGQAHDPRGLIPLVRAHDECPGLGETVRRLLERYPQVRTLRFLLGSLKQPWPSVKRYAARELINLESPEMIEPLLAATKDPDVDVQRAAVQALAKFSKRPEVYQRLIEIRDSLGDESTRQYAVATLLGMGEANVVGPLLQATRDDDLEVQYAAVQALGKFAARPEVHTRLIEMLDYGDMSVREKCIETLGEYQVKAAVEPLIRLLGNPFLKFRAQEALVRLGDRKGLLAIKRHKIREKHFGKKKNKGPVAPTLRKGKAGLGRSGGR